MNTSIDTKLDEAVPRHGRAPTDFVGGSSVNNSFANPVSSEEVRQIIWGIANTGLFNW